MLKLKEKLEWLSDKDREIGWIEDGKDEKVYHTYINCEIAYFLEDDPCTYWLICKKENNLFLFLVCNSHYRLLKKMLYNQTNIDEYYGYSERFFLRIKENFIPYVLSSELIFNSICYFDKFFYKIEVNKRTYWLDVISIKNNYLFTISLSKNSEPLLNYNGSIKEGLNWLDNFIERERRRYFYEVTNKKRHKTNRKVSIINY